MSLIQQHWRGNLPRQTSFWSIFVIFGLLGLPVISDLLVAAFSQSLDQPRSSQITILTIVVKWCCFVWASVGCWRASGGTAANFHGDGLARINWGAAIRICVVIVLVFQIKVSFIDDVKMIYSNRDLLFGQDRFSSIKIDVSDDGTLADLSGELGFGSFEIFMRTMEQYPDVHTIRLNSTGGRVKEGVAIAREIQKKKFLQTRVERRCLSACTLIFLSAKTRSIGPHGRIGFHSFATTETGDTIYDDEGKRQADQLYQEYGLPSEFVNKIIRVPPGEVYFPSVRELRDLGIIN